MTGLAQAKAKNAQRTINLPPPNLILPVSVTSASTRAGAHLPRSASSSVNVIRSEQFLTHFVLDEGAVRHKKGNAAS